MLSQGHVTVPCSQFVTEYWRAASRPLASLIFVSPMLIAYESGLLLLGPTAMRNGADVWLRGLLEGIGFSQYFLLPLLTTGILLGWHHVQRDRWRVDWVPLYGMLLESLTLGLVLLVVADWPAVWQASRTPGPLLEWADRPEGTCRMIAFLGAGIYEELLFRLMLLPVLFAVAHAAGLSRKVSWASAVVVGSLMFAAAHYRLTLAVGGMQFGPTAGDSFAWTTFTFRAAAGVFFSVLFLYRGFGVAAGAHAAYDILVEAL